MSLSSAPSGPYLLGIDEAGRGPVLGPMVYAYAACPIAAKDELAAMGFADSKSINKAQRESLLQLMCASPILQYHTIALSPQQLSADMQRAARVSLNVLSHDAAISLIRHAVERRRLRVAEVYVDTVGDPRSYAAKLESLFPDIRITVSAKADSLFPIVSAASIAAKCDRDEAIQQWKFTESTPSTATQQQQHSSSNHPPLVQRSEHVDDSEQEEEGEEAEPVAVSRKRRIEELEDVEDSEDRVQRDEAGDGLIDHDMGSGYPGGPHARCMQPWAG